MMDSNRNTENVKTPIFKIFSSSRPHSRAQAENERTDKPLDTPSAFSLQLSSLKLPKRLDKSLSANTGNHTSQPFLPLQQQRRLPSQLPTRLSTPCFSPPISRNHSSFPTLSPLVPLNPRTTTDDADNHASSLFLMSQVSGGGAYTHSKCQREASPNPHTSCRLPSPKQPGTHKSSSGYSAQASRNQHPDEATLDQLQALFASKDRLQSQIDKLDYWHSHASQERDEYRSQLASTTSQLESVNAELVHICIYSKEKIAALQSELVTMTASLSEAKSELSVVSGDRERLREAHAQDRAENDQLRKRVEASKKSIAALRERFNCYDMEAITLKKAHDTLCININNAKKDAEESKTFANNALAAMVPLADRDATLKRAADTKAVLRELQDDLAACLTFFLNSFVSEVYPFFQAQRVTDLLRDKLHNQTSLLAEARDRIRDLEEEKRGSLGALLQERNEVNHKIELFADVEIKLEELAEKLASRELETIDVLANSAALTTELEILRKASEANELEVAALCVIKEESISKLLVSQGVINLQEKEIVSLKAEVKALGETRAESRTLLGEAKKLLAEKEVELRAKDPKWDLEDKVKELDTQVASLKTTLQTCQETLQGRETEIQHKVNDVEKLDAELALSKTTIAKLRDDLEELRSNEGRKYEVLIEQIRMVFRNQEQVLQESNVELKERLEVQSVSLFQAKEESSKLKTALAVAQEQMASNEALVNLHVQRVSLMETQLIESQAKVKDLKSQFLEAEAELKSAQKNSIISDQTIYSTMHERTNELEKMVKDLEEQNDDLSRRSADILARYQQGKMNDVEKSFVAYIMKQTQDIHTQGVVTKDMELRKRETIIQGLRARIADMKVTIARLIKEECLKQAGPPMADAETSTHSPKNGTPGQNFVTPTAADRVVLTVTNPSAPVKLSDPKFSQLACEDDEDSEDDIPLSELSLPSDDIVSLKRRRPASASVPDEPIRSKRRTRESIPQAAPAPPIPAAVTSSSSSIKKVTMPAVIASKKGRK